MKATQIDELKQLVGNVLLKYVQFVSRQFLEGSLISEPEPAVQTQRNQAVATMFGVVRSIDRSIGHLILSVWLYLSSVEWCGA